MVWAFCSPAKHHSVPIAMFPYYIHYINSFGCLSREAILIRTTMDPRTIYSPMLTQHILVLITTVCSPVNDKGSSLLLLILLLIRGQCHELQIPQRGTNVCFFLLRTRNGCRTRLCNYSGSVCACAQFDASRREKKMLNSSRDKREGSYGTSRVGRREDGPFVCDPGSR